MAEVRHCEGVKARVLIRDCFGENRSIRYEFQKCLTEKMLTVFLINSKVRVRDLSRTQNDAVSTIKELLGY